MPIPQKRRPKSEKTRRRIYDAATSLLKERPYEHITVRDIVQRAGVATGTFYIYFPSKLSVYFEVYRYTDRYFSEVVRKKLTQTDIEERILAFFQAVADNIVEFFGMELTRLMFSPNNHIVAPRLNSYETVRILRDILAQGAETGWLPPHTNIDYAVLRLMIGARGAILHWCMCNGDHDLADSMKNCVTLMLAGLRKS